MRTKKDVRKELINLNWKLRETALECETKTAIKVLDISIELSELISELIAEVGE